MQGGWNKKKSPLPVSTAHGEVKAFHSLKLRRGGGARAGPRGPTGRAGRASPRGRIPARWSRRAPRPRAPPLAGCRPLQALGAQPGCRGPDPARPQPQGRGHRAWRAKPRGEGPTRAAGTRGLGQMRRGRAQPRGTRGSRTRGSPGLDRAARAEAPAPPAARMVGACPAAERRAPGSAGAEGRGPGAGSGENGAGPRGDGGKSRPAREPVGRMRRAAGQAQAAARPQWAPPSARAMLQVHLAAGLRGQARARLSPRGSLPACSRAGQGSRPGTAGRSPHSPVRGSAACAGAALPAPWSRRAAAVRRPHPAPPRTAPHRPARSGASDAAFGPATAAATPPPSGGPGRSERGAQRRLHQPGPARPAASPGLASASANGGAQGRGAPAPRGGGLRRRWLSP